VRQSDDNYVFDTATDPLYSKLGGFYPADNRLFGDDDGSGHNEQFTFRFDANFVYDESADQFFEALADAEVWVFIDDKLVIDMGGFHGPLTQRIDLDRLCLNDGQTYKLSFFYAHRYVPQSTMRLETNIQFIANGAEVAVHSPFD
jgi:fibro-slime domain-containing protein